MKKAIKPATPNAATMGTARIMGVVMKAPTISDKMAVGSNADTSNEDEGAIKAARRVLLALTVRIMEGAGAKASATTASPRRTSMQTRDCLVRLIMFYVDVEP